MNLFRGSEQKVRILISSDAFNYSALVIRSRYNHVVLRARDLAVRHRLFSYSAKYLDWTSSKLGWSDEVRIDLVSLRFWNILINWRCMSTISVQMFRLILSNPWRGYSKSFQRYKMISGLRDLRALKSFHLLFHWYIVVAPKVPSLRNGKCRARLAW